MQRAKGSAWLGWRSKQAQSTESLIKGFESLPQGYGKPSKEFISFQVFVVKSFLWLWWREQI